MAHQNPFTCYRCGLAAEPTDTRCSRCSLSLDWAAMSDLRSLDYLRTRLTQWQRQGVIGPTIAQRMLGEAEHNRITILRMLSGVAPGPPMAPPPVRMRPVPPSGPETPAPHGQPPPPDFVEGLPSEPPPFFESGERSPSGPASVRTPRAPPAAPLVHRRASRFRDRPPHALRGSAAARSRHPRLVARHSARTAPEADGAGRHSRGHHGRHPQRRGCAGRQGERPRRTAHHRPRVPPARHPSAAAQSMVLASIRTDRGPGQRLDRHAGDVRGIDGHRFRARRPDLRRAVLRLCDGDGLVAYLQTLRWSARGRVCALDSRCLARLRHRRMGRLARSTG